MYSDYLFESIKGNVINILTILIKCLGFKVVPGVGVEPTRKYKFRGILSPLCLPISPPGQWRRVSESN